MISTTKQTKNSIFKKIIKIICVTTFWILIWEAAARFVSRDNELMLIIFPTPVMVFEKWTELIVSPAFIKSILLTLYRVFWGFALGAIIGFFLGILTHLSDMLYSLLSPILKIIRAVPVVAIILLLYVFFENSTMPILIVILMVIPLLWQSVHDGLENTEMSLIEMASVYKISKFRTIVSIKLPHISANVITSAVNALGLAWKSGVAAEVICSTDFSLGILISQGKNALNNDEVFATTLTVVLLSIIIEYLFKFLCKKYVLRNGGNTDDQT